MSRRTSSGSAARRTLESASRRFARSALSRRSTSRCSSPAHFCFRALLSKRPACTLGPRARPHPRRFLVLAMLQSRRAEPPRWPVCARDGLRIRARVGAARIPIAPSTPRRARGPLCDRGEVLGINGNANRHQVLFEQAAGWRDQPNPKERDKRRVCGFDARNRRDRVGNC